MELKTKGYFKDLESLRDMVMKINNQIHNEVYSYIHDKKSQKTLDTALTLSNKLGVSLDSLSEIE